MSSSLQEQLVQAGLADNDSLERTRGNDKRRRRGRKGGGGKKAGGGATSDARSRGAGGNPPKGAAQPDSRKHGARPAREPTAAEKADRLRQMIRANRIDRAYAGVPYRFTEGQRVSEIAVTGTQQGRIARGELAIVKDGERYELVPAKIARRIRGTDPQAVVVLNSEGGGASASGGEGDDPYADYPVPDDLMW